MTVEKRILSCKNSKDDYLCMSVVDNNSKSFVVSWGLLDDYLETPAGKIVDWHFVCIPSQSRQEQEQAITNFIASYKSQYPDIDYYTSLKGKMLCPI